MKTVARHVKTAAGQLVHNLKISEEVNMNREYSDSGIILGKLDVSIDKSNEINRSLNLFLHPRYKVKTIKENDICIVDTNKNLDDDIITNGKDIILIKSGNIRILKAENEALMVMAKFIRQSLHEILLYLGILNDIEIYRYDEDKDCLIFTPCLFDKRYFFLKLINILKKYSFAQFSLTELANFLKKLSSSSNKNIKACVVMYDRNTLKTKRICKKIDYQMLEYVKFDIESAIIEDLIIRLFDNVITFRIFQVNNQEVQFL